MKKLDPASILGIKQTETYLLSDGEYNTRAIVNLCDEINSRFEELIASLTSQVGQLSEQINAQIQASVVSHLQVIKAELVNLKNQPVQPSIEARYTVTEILNALRSLAKT